MDEVSIHTSPPFSLKTETRGKRGWNELDGDRGDGGVSVMESGYLGMMWMMMRRGEYGDGCFLCGLPISVSFIRHVSMQLCHEFEEEMV